MTLNLFELYYDAEQTKPAHHHNTQNADSLSVGSMTECFPQFLGQWGIAAKQLLITHANDRLSICRHLKQIKIITNKNYGIKYDLRTFIR